MRAKDIMSTPVVTVRETALLKDVAAILVSHGISAVPVVDGCGEILGVVSEGDVMRLQAVDDPRRHVQVNGAPDEAARTAGEVMTVDVLTVAEDADVTQVARLMLDRSVKRIPVVAGRVVIGIISRRDIMKVLARSDHSIHAELQARLDDEAAMIGAFRATVLDGVVMLQGPEDAGARRLAELIARSVPGVVAVRTVEG